MRKKILEAILILLAEALLALAEKHFFLHGLGFAFCLALLFCRVHPAVAIAPYAIGVGLIHFDLTYLAVVGAGTFLSLLSVVLNRKAKLKYSIWANIAMIMVSQMPVFLLICETTEQYIVTAVSVLLCATYHYASVAVAYPTVRRGLRYGLTARERVFACLFCLPLAAGLATIDVFGVRFAFFAIAATAVFFGRLGEKGMAVGFSVAMGLGATFVSGTPFDACAAVAIAGGAAVFGAVSGYFGGFGAFGGYCLCLYLFGGAFSWQTLVPVGVAALVGFLPERAYVYFRSFRDSNKGKFALRTVANRDREEVSAKLRSVAGAFRKARSVLAGERGEEITPETVANGIAEACCRECPRFAACRKKIGDARKYFMRDPEYQPHAGGGRTPGGGRPERRGQNHAGEAALRPDGAHGRNGSV